jgi:hypothetical protein
MSSIPAQLIVFSDVFEFRDGTLHFIPTVPFAVADQVRLKVGDDLELRRPDGSVIKATLLGFDMFSPSNWTVGLSLGKPLGKSDVPVGTEIWEVG